MSVTLVFRCYHDDPACESIGLREEVMAVADMVCQAGEKQCTTGDWSILFDVLVGTFGTSVYDDGDTPRIIRVDEVADISRMLNEITPEGLREVYDLDRLKADCREISESQWEYLGPDVLEKHLIPMFEEIRGLFDRAAGRQQNIVVSWF